MDIDSIVALVGRDLFQHMVAVRRDLHREPELSWQETRTADAVCRSLAELAVPFRRGVGGTGVIADIPGPAGVPAIALRADLDALPLTEQTGLPFASVRPGIMHACGHDGHTAMLLGAAQLLVQGGAAPAPVRLLFQPAEEVGEGARALVDAGVLDGVALVFGIHLDRLYPTGVIVVSEGPVNASTDEFVIEITGPGGHAARPHESVDTIVVASLLVSSLQTIVARRVPPGRGAVVTVGRIEGGSAPNVLAGHVRLEGTLRAENPEVRSLLASALRETTEHVALAHGAGSAVTIREGTPSVVNRTEPTAIARAAAQAVVGIAQVRPLGGQNMGGEDFGYYLERVPGCLVRIGGQPPAGPGYPAHSSRFDFDERALAVGAAYLREAAVVAGRHVVDSRTPLPPRSGATERS